MTPPPLIRIAHHGGGSLAAPNSLEGIELSLAYHLEMIEVDVRCTNDGKLVLSHFDHIGDTAISRTSLADLCRDQPGVATLDDALDLVGDRTTLNLDIKDGPSISRVPAALRAHAALDRCIISCLETKWLVALADFEPTMPVFLSYPADRGGASQKPWLKPVVNAAVSLMRSTLPFRLRRMVQPVPNAGVTLFHPLITPRLVALTRAMHLPLYTWTVDDPERMRQLVDMGVDGITSNRPDLLATLAPTTATEPATPVR